MAASSAESVSESSSALQDRKKGRFGSERWRGAGDRAGGTGGWGGAALPLLSQLLAVKLPLLLVDGVEVQYDQTKHHEEDGSGRHQHFQGQVDGVWLGAASSVVSCETEAAAIF